MKMGVFYSPRGEQPPIIRALANIGAERKNQDAAMLMVRVRRRVAQAAQDFEARWRELVSEHGTIEDDGSWRVPPENRDAFVADVQELCDVDVPAEMLVEKIRLADLWRRGENGERVLIDLSEDDIEALGELIEQPTPSTPMATGQAA